MKSRLSQKCRPFEQIHYPQVGCPRNFAKTCLKIDKNNSSASKTWKSYLHETLRGNKMAPEKRADVYMADDVIETHIQIPRMVGRMLVCS